MKTLQFSNLICAIWCKLFCNILSEGAEHAEGAHPLRHPFPNKEDLQLTDYHNILHVSINNSWNDVPTKILILFLIVVRQFALR